MNGDKLAQARQAIAYSHNFATAKPDIGATEREHILGLCDVLSGIIAAHSAQGVGDGWVLVPREPTPEMLHALCHQNDGDVGECQKCPKSREHETFGTCYPLCMELAHEKYQAMLAAAPTKETP